MTFVVLGKIVPIYGKGPNDTPYTQLKGLINVVSTHFDSLENPITIKVKNEFDEKRYHELYTLNAKD